MSENLRVKYVGKGGEQYFRKELPFIKRALRGTNYGLKEAERPRWYPKNKWKSLWTVVKVKSSKRARAYTRRMPIKR